MLEKDRRIYYQNIVYAVCTQLDKLFPGRLVCGTLNDPSTEVEDTVKKLCDSKLDIQEITYNPLTDSSTLVVKGHIPPDDSILHVKAKKPQPSEDYYVAKAKHLYRTDKPTDVQISYAKHITNLQEQ